MPFYVTENFFSSYPCFLTDLIDLQIKFFLSHLENEKNLTKEILC